MDAAMTPNTIACRVETTRPINRCGVRSWKRVMFGIRKIMLVAPTRKNSPIARYGSRTNPIAMNVSPKVTKPTIDSGPLGNRPATPPITSPPTMLPSPIAAIISE